MKPCSTPKDFISGFETHAHGTQNASCVFESDHLCSRGLIGNLGKTDQLRRQKGSNGIWNRSSVSRSMRPLDKSQLKRSRWGRISRFSEPGLRREFRWSVQDAGAEKVSLCSQTIIFGGRTGRMTDLCACSVHSMAQHLQGFDLERWAASSNVAGMTQSPGSQMVGRGGF